MIKTRIVDTGMDTWLKVFVERGDLCFWMWMQVGNCDWRVECALRRSTQWKAPQCVLPVSGTRLNKPGDSLSEYAYANGEGSREANWEVG